MAIPSTSLHTRSISLPSACQQPDVSTEEHLHRLRASHAGPSSSSSICQDLCGIKVLLEHMNDLISLPRNWKAFSKANVDEVLEGSLALLDASGSAIGVVSQMNESILSLQSSLQRGNGDKGIHTYLVSRKKIRKLIVKSLVDLNKVAKNHACFENDAITMKMLKEAESISPSNFRSVLSCVMGKQAMSKTHS